MARDRGRACACTLLLVMESRILRSAMRMMRAHMGATAANVHMMHSRHTSSDTFCVNTLNASVVGRHATALGLHARSLQPRTGH